jgi:lipopolysaccharide/colanic/teichoic acid biosynthesis glycosyltransferase
MDLVESAQVGAGLGRESRSGASAGGAMERGALKTQAAVIADISLIVPWSAASGSFYCRYGKRLFDIFASVIGLVLSFPILALAMVLIRLDSAGPVIYASRRLGCSGVPFRFYKLRSMYNGAHESKRRLLHLNEVDGPAFKLANDPRVTRVGRWLRRTSVDELPQLWNVLKGDMSLVGPRPPIPEEVEKYEPWQRRRLDVKPGITCLWQISGRSKLGFNEWMRLDLEYIKHRSFRLDIKILLRTVPAVLSQEGAY